MKNNDESKLTAFMFVLVPTLFVIIGIFYFPHRYTDAELNLISIPLFISLIFLGIGALFKKEKISNILKIIGWVGFAFFWSTQINALFYGEEGDYVNAFICSAGLYFFMYFAYHEWLSIKRNEKIGCLNWLAGATAISGFIYFGIELTPLEMWLREVVAAQSGWVLNLVVGGGVETIGVNIRYGDASVFIIFACTGIQAMVLFVGMILPLSKASFKNRFYGLLITVVPVYFLNLLRNALVVFLVAANGPDYFWMAHNVIGKGGGLIVLIILLFFVIKILPEIFDEINSVIDLPKRNGPIERVFSKMLGK